ncbi:MAG: hypothetical protein ACLTW7_16140 [Enterococcus sp.]|uniref:hypothetical protein n=1 Tax=Enterococcus sp. TaxID=35783 RepID=UPI003995615E
MPNSSAAQPVKQPKNSSRAQYQQKIAALDQQITELAAKVQALDERIGALDKVFKEQ